MEDYEKVSVQLFVEIKKIIEEAKEEVAVNFSSITTIMNWAVGKEISDRILDSKRAEYGKRVVKLLSEQLTEEYGKGWSEKQLRHCLRIAKTFPDREIIYALSRQLSWTHFNKRAFEKNFSIIKSEKFKIENITIGQKGTHFAVCLIEFNW